MMEGVHPSPNRIVDKARVYECILPWARVISYEITPQAVVRCVALAACVHPIISFTRLLFTFTSPLRLLTSNRDTIAFVGE